MIENSSHWDNLYRTKKPDSVSWFQPSLQLSLELIRKSGIPRSASIIDVGGGASTLVDDLLDDGYSSLTILDISEEALNQSKERLGPRSKEVNWIIGNIVRIDLPHDAFDLWHDRAAFHFLTTDAERVKYCEGVRRAIRPGGFLIMATFGPNGPLRCSGLDTMRYSPESLSRALGIGYHLEASQTESHVTPTGVTQEFIYCLFRVAR